jgi:hypothetical protein
LYCAIRLIGASSNASNYKYEFKLTAGNGNEEKRGTFFVRKITEDWETIFNSGKCFRVDQVTFSYFVLENKLKLTTILYKVE